ncbi:MAG: hypothetical protein MK291_06805 [Planctomycetes bacterium]|nr:hypothetical protein [Planctomycetota bacterium]
MTLSWTCALLLTLPLASELPSGSEQLSPEELARSLSLMSGDDSASVAVDGFLRATRLDATGGSPVANSELGTRIDHARLRLRGGIKDFSWRVDVDALDSQLSLQDAYISHDSAFDESLDAKVTLGSFRAPFLSSSLLDGDRLLFPARTRNGVFYSVRSPGVSAEGTQGDLGWAAAIQDGVLDPSEHMATLRFTYDFTGLGAMPWEGALRSDFKSRFWGAVAVSNEDSLGSGIARALELHYISGRYSLSCEWLGYGGDYDEEEGVGPWSPDPGNFIWGERRGGTHPVTLTGTYMFIPDLVELAVRWEDFDDTRGAGFTNTGDPADVDYDRKNFYMGLNYYVDGHDMKFHLGQLKESRDGFDDSDDISWWGVGMSLSF